MVTSSKVFVSHAGPDTETAKEVAEALDRQGLEAVLDRKVVGAGDSFVAFMEDALSTSDYCLLLWSEIAASRKWVELEWQTALYRSVQEARAFLAVGRLDDHPLPALLGPRLFVELHPHVEPGLGELVKSWQDDRAAEEESNRIVGSTPTVDHDKPEGETVYVTSDLFGITSPWQVDLDAPAGLLLDEVTTATKLPTSLEHEGRVGLRFDYRLTVDDQRLERTQSLAAQGVEPKNVLWIESEIRMFTPDSDRPAGIFRGSGDEDGVEEARALLLSRIDEAGLGLRWRGK